MFSKVRLQLSHTNLPSSSLGGGPEWPDFQRCEGQRGEGWWGSHGVIVITREPQAGGRGAVLDAGGVTTCEHEVQSVAGPSGPVLLLLHSCPLHWHQVHRHVPPSQKRR